MLKDTKSLGNNKAPACESRGFVHKKRGVHFDTPPCGRTYKLTRMYVFYFTSNTTIDLAGRVTFKLPLLTFAPLNSLGATTSGFSKLL